MVRPCKAVNVCAADPISSTGMATNAFRKESPAITSHDVATEVVGGASRVTSTEVTFDWDDYFDTNQAHVWSTTGELSPQAGRNYRIQVSDTPTFSSTANQNIDDKVVDQSTYTGVPELYPEGTLYWRVQAIDGDENALAWSPTRSFVKQSPQVALTGPDDMAQGSGMQQLTWEPQAFASGYELAVSKDGDANFSDATKLFANKTLKQVGYVWDSPITVSNLPYYWRVRRKDTTGNVGPWSTARSFYVRGEAPTQISPAADSFQPGNGPLFTWNRVDGAASYVLEVRTEGSTSTWATITTPASSWATVKPMPAGSWQWRVTARNSASSPRVLGISEWRQLSVVTGPTATTAPVVTGSGRVGTPLNASAPEWDLPGVTNTWQWKSSGVNIPGATGQSYEVTAEDVGRSISVTVSGSAAGYQPGTTTSNATLAVAAAAPTATTPTQVSGTGKVGTTLTSTMPTWSLTDVSSTRQWLRNNVAISGATDTTYAVRPTDVGATITLKVTGTRNGHHPGSSVSNGVVGVQGDAPAASTPPTGSPAPARWTTCGPRLRCGTARRLRQRPSGCVTVRHPRLTGDHLSGRHRRMSATHCPCGTPARPRATPRATWPAARPRDPAATPRPPPPRRHCRGAAQGGLHADRRPRLVEPHRGDRDLQWLRDGAPIGGETSDSHVLNADDLGRRLSARVTGPGAGTAARHGLQHVGAGHRRRCPGRHPGAGGRRHHERRAAS